jgi:mannobiose 2-epimerase
MNTSLHILESLANLYRVWQSPIVKDRLQEMIIVTLEKIINPETNRQFYFFDRDWKSIADIKSYGHDIECSWLLLEAAEVLGDKDLIERVEKASIAMAESTLEALNQDGSLINESVDGNNSKSLQWWVQAEAVVGFINAWQLTNDEVWIDRALSAWEFTEDNFVDKEYGEWFWGFGDDGQLNKSAPKVSAWKCPYHNSRMSIEVLRRLSEHNH